jgi:hypothetical protein
MARDDARVDVIERYLATKRRINDIARNAHSRLGSPAAEGSACSFCGWAADDVHVLIQGSGDARICSECVEKLGGMLKDDHGD